MESGLLVIPFFRQLTWPLLAPAEQSSLNYFASAWCALENILLAATSEGLGTVFHIPVGDEAGKIKRIVGAPEDYEFTCLLTMGYPAENAFLPKQKEIRTVDRIHKKQLVIGNRSLICKKDVGFRPGVFFVSKWRSKTYRDFPPLYCS